MHLVLDRVLGVHNGDYGKCLENVSGEEVTSVKSDLDYLTTQKKEQEVLVSGVLVQIEHAESLFSRDFATDHIFESLGDRECCVSSFGDRFLTFCCCCVEEFEKKNVFSFSKAFVTTFVRP